MLSVNRVNRLSLKFDTSGYNWSMPIWPSCPCLYGYNNSNYNDFTLLAIRTSKIDCVSLHDSYPDSSCDSYHPPSHSSSPYKQGCRVPFKKRLKALLGVPNSNSQCTKN